VPSLAVPSRSTRDQNSEAAVLRWALIFFIIALVAAALGFGGIASTAAGIAQVFFYIFLVLFLVALLTGLFVGRRAIR
jgi:uncharacterized membrane protein YtjA (UPF0391 family)